MGLSGPGKRVGLRTWITQNFKILGALFFVPALNYRSNHEQNVIPNENRIIFEKVMIVGCLEGLSCLLGLRSFENMNDPKFKNFKSIIF